MNLDGSRLKFFRQQFPQGGRIKLRELRDSQEPVKPGSKGTLESIAVAGTPRIPWNNGSTRSLIPEEVSFPVNPPELATLKLYMPMTADLYERNGYGDLEEEGIELDGRDLPGFQYRILAELEKNRLPEEAERGVMHWYQDLDEVNAKVRSVVFTAEVRDKQLWGVAECQVVGTLTPEELDKLKEYITEQAADGWGEGFEQCEIKTADCGELYVHLWNGGREWSIETEQERFALRLTDDSSDKPEGFQAQDKISQTSCIAGWNCPI